MERKQLASEKKLEKKLNEIDPECYTDSDKCSKVVQKSKWEEYLRFKKSQRQRVDIPQGTVEENVHFNTQQTNLVSINGAS